MDMGHSDSWFLSEGTALFIVTGLVFLWDKVSSGLVSPAWTRIRIPHTFISLDLNSLLWPPHWSLPPLLWCLRKVSNLHKKSTFLNDTSRRNRSGQTTSHLWLLLFKKLFSNVIHQHAFLTFPNLALLSHHHSFKSCLLCLCFYSCSFTIFLPKSGPLRTIHQVFCCCGFFLISQHKIQIF